MANESNLRAAFENYADSLVVGGWDGDAESIREILRKHPAEEIKRPVGIIQNLKTALARRQTDAALRLDVAAIVREADNQPQTTVEQIIQELRFSIETVRASEGRVHIDGAYFLERLEALAATEESTSTDGGLRAAVEAWIDANGERLGLVQFGAIWLEVKRILDANPPAPDPLAMLEEMRGTLTPMRCGWSVDVKLPCKKPRCPQDGFALFVESTPADAIRLAYAEWVKAQNQTKGEK